MKKIKQWFIGCVVSLFGGYIYLMGYGVFVSFVGMMESTGKGFVGNFIMFVLCLLIVLFLPYLMFHAIKDGVKEEFK